MYNIKLYNRQWFFLETLPSDRIECSYSFTGNINSWLSNFSFVFHEEREFKHREIIKLYKNWTLIYQGFIVGIDQYKKNNNNQILIKCCWMIWLLAFSTIDLVTPMHQQRVEREISIVEKYKPFRALMEEYDTATKKEIERREKERIKQEQEQLRIQNLTPKQRLQREKRKKKRIEKQKTQLKPTKEKEQESKIESVEILEFEATPLTVNPSQMIRDMFQDMDLFDATQVQDYHSNITIIPKRQSKLELLQEILSYINDRYFYIDAQNIIHFHEADIHHILSYNKECINIEIQENNSDYYNDIMLFYRGEDVSLNREKKTYLPAVVHAKNEQDITNFWLSQLIVEDEDIISSESAILRAKTILTQKQITKTIKITVNLLYPIETLQPWHILSVRNTDKWIYHEQIQSITYNKDGVTIVCGVNKNLESTIQKK